VSLRTYRILNNAAERQEFSNAGSASRNSPTVYNRCSKCLPFARILSCSQSRHWLTALSITFWWKRRHSSINRSFRWSTSAKRRSK